MLSRNSRSSNLLRLLAIRHNSTSTSKYALTCPGQGLVRAGLLKPYMKYQDHFKYCLQEADEALKQNFTSKLIDENIPLEFYHKTANSQPAILLTSYIISTILQKEFGIDLVAKSNYVLGHSLGEFTSLLLAGAFSLYDAVYVVNQRGLLMEKVLESKEEYGMITILTRPEKFEEIFKFLEQPGNQQFLANINSHQQIVLSGKINELHKKIDDLNQSLKLKKPLKTIQLPVKIPFHSTILRTIEPELSHIINVRKSPNKELKIPIISNLNGISTISQSEALKNVLQATSRPVQWVKSIESLNEKVDVFINLGPGEVLSGLNKKIISIENINLDTLEQIDKIHNTLT